MSHGPWKSFFAAALAAASLVLLTFAVDDGLAQGTPAAPAETANAQGAQPGDPAPAAGRGRGRGRGGPPVDTLGEGPWDIETEAGTVHVSVVTRGLDRGWGMAFLPNGDMLVTERAGRMRVIRNGVLDPSPIGGLPAIRAAGLGGLLDLTLHPDFEQNGLVYFVYGKPGPEDNPAFSAPTVARARWDGGATLRDVEDIFSGEAFGGTGAPRGCCGQGPSDGNSLGSRLAFDDDGFLYVTLGDRNYGEQAQDPSSLLGKIVRIRDDGTLPPDNPFAGRAGYHPAIYTLGHRNPLGLFFHPVTGQLWETEFGPRGGDELNLIEAGKNYGWILVTKGNHYDGTPAEGVNNVPGMEEPVLAWGPPSINPGNLAFYEADALAPWKGNLLMAAMSRSLLRVVFDDDGRPVDQERMLGELGQRFRDVRVGPDGRVYLLTDEPVGAMLRIDSIE
jgi:glucose/arabinose dehydrogenase